MVVRNCSSIMPITGPPYVLTTVTSKVTFIVTFSSRIHVDGDLMITRAASYSWPGMIGAPSGGSDELHSSDEPSLKTSGTHGHVPSSMALFRAGPTAVVNMSTAVMTANALSDTRDNSVCGSFTSIPPEALSR